MRPDADRFVISCFVCEKKRPVLQSIRCSGAADCILNDTATTEIYTLSLHDALDGRRIIRSEEHTSELQSHDNLVCRLLLEQKRDVERTAVRLDDQSTHCSTPVPVRSSVASAPCAPPGSAVFGRFFFKNRGTPEISPLSSPTPPD